MSKKGKKKNKVKAEESQKASKMFEEKQKTSFVEPWYAVLLSLAIPGLGQFYCGQFKQQAKVLIVGIVLFFLLCFIALAPKIEGWSVLVSYILFKIFWGWNLYDAFQTAKRQNASSFENERKASKDPWFALFLSMFLFLGAGHFYLKKWIFGLLFFLSFVYLSYQSFSYSILLLVFYQIIVCFHVYFSAPVRRETSNKPVFALFALKFGLLLSFLFIMNFLIGGSVFLGDSMAPTIKDNDFGIINKFIYRFEKPKRGDIVVLNSPTDPTKKIMKRIIAIGGDTLETRKGIYYVNQKKFEHPVHKFLAVESISDTSSLVTIPKDHVYVLGDNSDNSYDSRRFGSIPVSSVKSKVIKVIPFSRISFYLGWLFYFL